MMAAKSAIGMMINEAMERISNAAPDIVLPTQGRDADLLHAQQLLAIAEYLETHQPAVEALEPMGNGLTEMLAQKVVAVPKIVSKPMPKGGRK